MKQPLDRICFGHPWAEDYELAAYFDGLTIAGAIDRVIGAILRRNFRRRNS